LWRGVRAGEEKRALTALDRGVISFPINDSVWERASDLMIRSRAIGLTAPVVDVVVVATAVQHGLEIEHNDLHFDELLKVAARG